jgi:hypothetical protein
MAILGTQGFGALPKYCSLLMLIFFLTSLAICGVRDVLPHRFAKFVPSPMSMGARGPAELPNKRMGRGDCTATAGDAPRRDMEALNVHLQPLPFAPCSQDHSDPANTPSRRRPRPSPND